MQTVGALLCCHPAQAMPGESGSYDGALCDVLEIYVEKQPKGEVEAFAETSI